MYEGRSMWLRRARLGPISQRFVAASVVLQWVLMGLDISDACLTCDQRHLTVISTWTGGVGALQMLPLVKETEHWSGMKILHKWCARPPLFRCGFQRREQPPSAMSWLATCSASTSALWSGLPTRQDLCKSCKGQQQQPELCGAM